MKTIRTACCLFAAAIATPAFADDLDQLQLLNQSEFRRLSEDLGSALSYKPLAPAEPLGVFGFDVGVAVTATSLRNTDIFRKASSGGDFPSTLPVPTLRGAVGLPFGIDIGLSYAAAPGTNIKYFGGDLKWAVYGGSTLLPAVAVRGAYTKLSGVSQLDFDTKSVDLSVSKGFLMFTPYAGIGQVWVDSATKGVPGLGGESFSMTKYFGGVNVNLGLINFAFEVDRTGEANTFGGKVGFRF
ncbi:MAG: hypothetical protein KIT73_10280 [Burkholderiales bacterium]|nr:hypothetical protein [Burkholderiales bacterium]